MRYRVVATLAVALALVAVSSCQATSTDPFAALGTAGPLNWAILYIGTAAAPTTTTVDLSAGSGSPNIGYTQVDGNVGINSGTLTIGDTRSTLTGTLWLNSAAQLPSASTLAQIIPDGTNPKVIYTPTNGLLSYVDQVMNPTTGAYYLAASMLTSIPTGAYLQPYSSITVGQTQMTIAGKTASDVGCAPGNAACSGLNVLNLSSLQVGSGGLVLTGDSTTKFVINVTGAFDTSVQDNNAGTPVNPSGTPRGVTLSGVLPQNVLYNMIGTGGGVDFTGHISTIDGIVLAPFRDINVSPGVINGELIGGGSIINVDSGSLVSQVPEPASLLLLGSGALFAGLWRRRT